MDPEILEIRRKFLKLVWPVLIQDFLLTLMFNIDTMMVGRLNEVALAAMGIIGPVRWAIMAIMLGVSIGTVATVARSVGERNPEKAVTFAATAYVVSGALGIVTTTIICLFAYRIPAIFIGDPEVVREAGKYMFITFLFFIFNYASMIGASVLRAAGDTQTPMVITVFSNLLNICGNYLLIFGKMGFPALGLYGAGISTAISKAVEGVLMTSFLFTRWSIVRLKPSSFRLVSMQSIRHLLKISIPASTEPFFVNSGFLVFTKMVASLGTFAMAANRIALAVESLSFMPGHSFSTTCATLVGQKIGEGSPKGVEASVKQSMKVSVMVMSSIGLSFLVIPHLLCRIFTDDPKLIALATICLMIGSLEQPFMGIVQILKGAFHGAGNTKTPVILGAIGVWGPRLFICYTLAIRWEMGLAGVWIATTVDWITRACLYIWKYREHQRMLHETLKKCEE
ncbi:MATE family efflux transporter [Candidatus Sumerlaeota bacterium]|nr:MATE family efflux transporter [Candidatus Sumerlaeota bacterium]